MTCQFWMHWFPIPGQVERVAEQAEELGFDGCCWPIARIWSVTRSWRSGSWPRPRSA